MSTSIPDILKHLSMTRSEKMMMEQTVRAKKRRLDHLSWEEKIQRKKLKNRVAAQTSRDRKKAKMEQMESALQELFQRNEKLTMDCDSLRLTNKRLQDENVELKNRLKGVVTCANCTVQNGSVESTAHNNNGSAVSDTFNLLPQGVSVHSAAVLNKVQTTTVNVALWKIVIACLLYQTFSTNSTETSILSRLNSSRRAFSKISPQTWRLLLKRQINKNQKLIQKGVLQKWWGRHQNNWNPMEVVA